MLGFDRVDSMETPRPALGLNICSLKKSSNSTQNLKLGANCQNCLMI